MDSRVRLIFYDPGLDPLLGIVLPDDTETLECVPMVGAIEEQEDGEVFAYLHGPTGGRFFKTNHDGRPLCLTATVVDGLVMAVTPSNHSAQYRTAILHGTTYPFNASYDADIDAEKVHALELMTNGITCDDRWKNTRLPLTEAALKAVGVIRVRIEGAAAKINSPQQPSLETHDDNPETLSKVWTGIIPLRMIALPAIPSIKNTLSAPEHIVRFSENFEKRVYGGAAPLEKRNVL